MKFNKNLFKTKEYKGVKPYKYVPLLERQCRIYKNSRDDWIDTALDLKESADYQEKIKDKLMFFLLVIAGLLAGESIILIKFLVRLG
ncbi:MAG: hypothetical protein NT076_03765 [Candidatus Pacearchaeota archaeon]|nr:hypothetical protein [Candidatus Pacearchaeota archaeon]